VAYGSGFPDVVTSMPVFSPSRRPSADDLALLTAVIRDVSRTHRLRHPDAQDFAQSVHLRLIERDYEVFQRFDGRGSLRAYLTVVVTRLLLDWRNAVHGKWRPTAAARRSGPVAVALDRLINRDGSSVDEAVSQLQARGAATIAALRDLADRLPRRPKRRFVSEEALTEHPEPFLDPIESREAAIVRRHSHGALASACHQLDADDRRLLALRFHRACSVQQISRMLKVDPRRLYRRFDRTFRTLRSALRDAGITAAHPQ
jgi:RNA polymerase sigma factor (sigma-70 family)